MKEIELTQGRVAQVSDHRFEYLNQWKWYAHQDKKGHWYAMRNTGKRPFKSIVYMHREIAGVTDPMIEVDHWDGDGLNNTDDNLRVCTKSQNMCNRGKTTKNTSGFKGVSWNKLRKKFSAQIRVSGKKIHLGLFVNPSDAASAYDIAAEKYHGKFSKINLRKE